MKTSNNALRKLEESQAHRILAVLEASGLDFIVERTPTGWRVETEQRGPVEGVSCMGATLADALGQVTTVLGVELELDPEEDEIPNEPMPYALDEPVEFCKRFVRREPEYRQHLGTELGGDFLAAIAE